MGAEAVLVGSSVISGTLKRTPNDWDFICTKNFFDKVYEELKQEVREIIPTKKGYALTFFISQLPIEFEIVEENETTRKVFEYLCENAEKVGYFSGLQYLVACPDDIYMLKMSHRFLKDSPHFLKTRGDIAILRGEGCKIRNEEIFKLREADTYNYDYPKLNQTKKDFFTDNVNYIYDHDSIHEAMKHMEEPAYKYYAIEGEQVLSSKEKFFELPEMFRQFGVLEETYVLALERSVIPYNTDPQKAFLKALEKVCTSITSGWFREYAWENYYTIIGMWNPNYVTKFHHALAEGVVKRHKEETDVIEPRQNRTFVPN